MIVVSWNSYDPRHESTYRSSAHGVPDAEIKTAPLTASGTKIVGKTFCGKQAKAAVQEIEQEITCGACLRSKAYKATLKPKVGTVSGKYLGEPDF